MTLRHFSQKEFECKCGCGFNNVQDELIIKLDNARTEAGVPFTVTSGCRCEKHNQKVGGVVDSAHLTGEAADIATTIKTRMLIVRALLNNFDRAFINFEKDFVHVDISKSKQSPYLGTY